MGKKWIAHAGLWTLVLLLAVVVSACDTPTRLKNIPQPTYQAKDLVKQWRQNTPGGQYYDPNYQGHPSAPYVPPSYVVVPGMRPPGYDMDYQHMQYPRYDPDMDNSHPNYPENGYGGYPPDNDDEYYYPLYFD